MPIYEFQCRSCSHQFEHLILPWMDASEKPECPSCKAKDVERTLSICAISSASTRQANLTQARKKASSVTREKEDAEFKQMIEHANEHH